MKAIDKTARSNFETPISVQDALSRLRLGDGSPGLLPAFGSRQPRPPSKVNAWEEKKAKTPWGAQSVDYEKNAAAAVKAADLNHLLRRLIPC
jgi:hypothetical protein